jgi:hypothetical protein
MFPRTIGISIDDLWIGYAYGVDDATPTDKVDFGPFGNHGSFPNAILLPKIEGEPFRFDLGDVPHARGSGLTWPGEAIVDTDHGSGRLPVGRLLNRIETNNSFVWAIEEKRSFSCTDALAGAISQAFPNFDGEIVLVVPNHWNVELQQTLLDSFQKENLRCKLLWRPIAAALEWTTQYADGLKSSPRVSGVNNEMLLSVFVGHGEIEITELELVDWTTSNGLSCMVPGRRRPRAIERFPSFGFRQVLYELSKEGTINSNPLLDPDDLMSYAWNQLWCRPKLGAFLSGFRYRFNGVGRVADEVEQSVFGAKQLDLGELKVRLSAHRSKLKRLYAGIVFSGPLAAAKFDDQQSVHEFIRESLDTQSDRILIEDDKVGRGLLARGAHRFATSLANGLPTFLDTLPRLEMVILEKGEPTWIDLLEPEQKWVEGGKEWQRPERVYGLKLSPKSIDLKVAIAHEDFDDVREVVTSVPPTSEQMERVSLSVKMTPAQGNARIEVHPENEAIFRNKRVFIDWKHMREFLDANQNRTDKDGYLNAYPRIFPELLPRLSSTRFFHRVHSTLIDLQGLMETNYSPSEVDQLLKDAKDLLLKKDQGMYPRDATAFDSEGNCNGSFRLQEFIQIAWPYFEANRLNNFVRAIAYTHVDHPELKSLIINKIREPYVDEDYVLASGKCLRSPEEVSRFANAMLYQLACGRAKFVWWNALAELLRFRGSATQLLESADCMKLLKYAGAIFHTERKRGKAKQLFRTVCMAMVYMLRRRAFDDEFLPPESESAEWIKAEFRAAILDASAGRLVLMGGAVNLQEQLQLIIDYIDRRGKGQLLIGD